MNKTINILHIDDDSDDLYFFALAVKEFDARIELIQEKHSDLALQKLQSGALPAPDLFVLDWNMPKITAKNACKKLENSFLQAIFQW